MRNYDIMAAYSGKMKMQGRKKVYVETSVVSNLTARRSYNLIDAARQAATQTWWDTMRCEFDLFVSLLVIDEASKGDSDASRKRLEALKEMSVVTITREMEVLAERLLEATAVPRSSYEDAVHIAAATVGKMDYLLTWNCKHIANAVTMPKIFKVCNDSGYQCPIICTPEQLGKEENDE